MPERLRPSQDDKEPKRPQRMESKFPWPTNTPAPPTPPYRDGPMIPFEDLGSEVPGSWQKAEHLKGRRFFGPPLGKAALDALEARVEASKAGYPEDRVSEPQLRSVGETALRPATEEIDGTYEKAA
jgi:hypothetical protein